MGTFGEAVRVARAARGWTQQELAAQVKVSQRAVSSWERGVSEPRDAVKEAVADVLHLPPDIVPQRPGRQDPSGVPLLAELPFDNLAPAEFEDFAVSLAGALYPDAQAYRLGESGHAQHGFDVVVERDGKVVVGIQCKRVRRFGPHDVQAAITAATMEVATAMIFLSRSASPAARSVLRAHAGWQLWDKNKLSHAVHELPLHRSQPLIDRYFPFLRERFLGVPQPGPWLNPEQYFDYHDGKSFRHSWALVGQDETIEELVKFATGFGHRVGALVGRGGTGKSRMLYELCEHVRGQQVVIKFLEREPVIDHTAFERLPSTGRLLIVIDDAHDEDAPIGKVVAGALSTNPDARILLALRPDGELRSRRQLRDANVDLQDLQRWVLTDLSLADATALAREVLGPEHGNVAARLALVTRDCPFLLVTGANLIRDGAIDVRHLEGDDYLRREVIETMVDTVSSDAADQPEVRMEALKAVAALQPLRTADNDFRAAIQELTGRVFDQVLPHLSAWEDTGALLRRGDTYRVVPDLLGDALLARSALAPETGAPTAYIERARQAASGHALANLIVNASRVDWQEPAARRGRLLASLWEALTAEFQAGNAAARVVIMNVLAKVAFYQPEPTLKVVRWALEHPAEEASLEAGLGLSYTQTDQDVRDAAAPVLRNAAYDPASLPQAAGLLWELARSDKRPPHQHPHHAMRMLGELAAYDRRGVTIYQQALPATVERWLRRPKRDDDVYDPLTVLQPLLATEAQDQTWSATALVLHPFLITPDVPAVVELRSTVLDLAFGELTSADLRRATAAVETIGAGLIGPLGGFGLQVTDEQRKPWATHFIGTLARLRDALRAQTPAPVVCVALRSQLQWHVEHAASDIRQAARDVVAALPHEPVYELARALHGGPIDPTADPTVPLNYQDRLAAQEQFFSRCIAILADVPAGNLTSLIEQLLDDLYHALGDQIQSRSFLVTAVTARPDLGEALCMRIQDAPNSRLTSVVAAVMSTLAQSGDPRVVGLAQQLLETGNVIVAREIAHGFGLQRYRRDLLEGEPSLLRSLVQHPDSIVVGATLGAVQFLAEQHQDLALELFAAVPSDRKDTSLAAFTMAFGPHGKLSWANLLPYQKDEFIKALRDAVSIDSYETVQFLAMLSRDDPHRVIDLLTERIKRMENSDHRPGYRPLPFSWVEPLQFRTRDDFPDLLRRVREWLAADPDSAWRHYFGSDLFSSVAGTFDEQTRQVIEEYLCEPDATRMRTVAMMLRGAPRSLVWDSAFVRKCLRAADECGDKSLSAVQSALHSALTTGGRWAAMGQPYPEDVEQRDMATRLAEQAVRGSVEEQFYHALSQSAERWIDRSISELNPPTDDREW